MFEPILPHELCEYPIRARQTIKRPSPYTLTNARRVASINAPKCTHPATKYFVSGNMELFCRINDKPRNATVSLIIVSNNLHFSSSSSLFPTYY